MRLESVAIISSSHNPTDALDLVTAGEAERLRASAVTPNLVVFSAAWVIPVSALLVYFGLPGQTAAFWW